MSPSWRGWLCEGVEVPGVGEAVKEGGKGRAPLQGPTVEIRVVRRGLPHPPGPRGEL